MMDTASTARVIDGIDLPPNELLHMRRSMALVELQVRPKLIRSLTGTARPVLKRFRERIEEAASDKGGRLPQCVEHILDDIRSHIEASVFLRNYLSFEQMFGQSDGDEVCTDSFVRALACQSLDVPGTELTPDHFMIVVKSALDGAGYMSSCSRGSCDCTYFNLIGSGGRPMARCPMCQLLAAGPKAVGLEGQLYSGAEEDRGQRPEFRVASGMPAPVRAPNGALVEVTTLASDELGTARNAMALAELGGRYQTIRRMTNLDRPVIMSFLKSVNGRVEDKGGRMPRYLSTYLESSKKHIDASLFLKFYLDFLGIFGASASSMVIHTDAFIRALLALRSSVDAEAFTADHAVSIAGLLHEGAVTTRSCQICPTTFLVATSPQEVRSVITEGECPVCRELAAGSVAKTSIRTLEPRRRRALFADLTGR